MVVLLHGCRQTPAEFADASRFTAAADRHGFVLVLPHQELRHHAHRCWRWYETAHQNRGRGEPAIIAGIAAQVVAEERRWLIDPRRVYVAGLSAGGGMALILAATYPDVFAAAGVHSAPAYRSATRSGEALRAMAARTEVRPPDPGTATAMAPTVLLQGTADEVVRPVVGSRVTEQWLAWRSAAAAGGGGPAPVAWSRVSTGRSDDGRGYTRQRWYTVRGRKVLEYWLIDGLGHAWSGGREDGQFSDPAGPRAAAIMWKFFSSHRLGVGRAGQRRWPAREASIAEAPP